METANELLRNVRDINRLKGDKAARPAGRPHPESTHAPSLSLDSQIGGAIDRLKLTGAETGAGAVDGHGRPLPSPAPDRQYQQQQPYVQPPVRPPTGGRIPVPPGYPQDTRPPPGAYDPGVPGSLDGYSPAGYPVNHPQFQNISTGTNLLLSQGTSGSNTPGPSQAARHDFSSDNPSSRPCTCTFHPRCAPFTSPTASTTTGADTDSYEKGWA